MQITINGAKHVVFSGSRYLMEMLNKAKPGDFPFSTTISKKDNDSYQFT